MESFCASKSTCGSVKQVSAVWQYMVLYVVNQCSGTRISVLQYKVVFFFIVSHYCMVTFNN